MCTIELEPCEVWSRTAHTARKEYRCECCGAKITPGARYHRTFSVFDGQVDTSRNCVECEADMQAFGAAHDGVLSQPDYFVEMLRDCIDNGDEESERQWKPMLAAIIQRRASVSP